MEQEVRHIPGDKLLVFGGVYSNYSALKELEIWAGAHGFTPETIVCTGDIVAYCAEAKESVDLVKEWGIHCIAGNVEIQLRNNEEDCGCNFNQDSSCDLLSQRWYPFAKAQLEKSHIDWMLKLPERLVLKFGGLNWGVVHGAASQTSKFIYKSTPWNEKEAELHLLQADNMIAGHCGVPFLDDNGSKGWINSGALGMPANDGTSRVWFVTIEKKEEGFGVTFHALEYAFERTQESMKNARLPEQYIETLVTGFWDSTDILRPEERMQTGKRITLDQKEFLI